MEEADVIRIVESSIAKKNKNQLASMKLMLETRTNIGSILKLAMLLKKQRKPVHPNSSTKSMLPLRKVRSFCQRGRSAFFWLKSQTFIGL